MSKPPNYRDSDACVLCIHYEEIRYCGCCSGDTQCKKHDYPIRDDMICDDYVTDPPEGQYTTAEEFFKSFQKPIPKELAEGIDAAVDAFANTDEVDPAERKDTNEN